MSSFNVEIDKIDRDNWDHLITQFDDASLFQTWSAGAVPGRNVSHIVVKEGEETLACCQATIRHMPFFNIGIADIKWGPLCMKKGSAFNQDVLFHLIRGIKNEYGIKRNCLIRISPHATGERKELLKQILESEGFMRNDSVRPYRSLRIDLSFSLDDLRKNLSRGWRRSLLKAEGEGLNMIEGTNSVLCSTLEKLAKECELMKEYKDNMDYGEYRRIQEDLPEPLKMRFFVCAAQGEPVCATAYSAIGDTGVYTLSGTGEKAYGMNATHLIQWSMIQRLKENGVRYFDLGPFNPQRNPGVYQFKLGIAGKTGWEEIFLGEYHGCFNLAGRMVKVLLNYPKGLNGMSKMKAWLPYHAEAELTKKRDS